jgi:hypothetical protein
LKKLFLILLILVALAALIDIGARLYVQTRVEAAARRELDGVGGVSAKVESFPFVIRLLTSGEVGRFRLTLTDVTGQPVPVERLEVDVHGIRFDRSQLLGGERAQITAIDSAELVATISESAISDVAGVAVDLEEGQVTVTFAGDTSVTAAVSVQDGVISFAAAGFPPVTVPVPSSDLLPCAVSGRVEHDAVMLTCTTDELPAIVVDAIGSIDLRDQLHD